MAKSKEKKEEKIETLTIRRCESQNLWVVRDSIEIKISEYPELEGKSLDEIKSYIEENIYDMKAPEGLQYADSLAEAIDQQDVIREKDTGTDYHIYFE